MMNEQTENWILTLLHAWGRRNINLQKPSLTGALKTLILSHVKLDGAYGTCEQQTPDLPVHLCILINAFATLKCLSIGTPKTINFPFVPNGKLTVFKGPKI